MQGRGGGGGGSPDLARVAITDFIRDNSQAQQKMMANFEKLQASQAQAAREDSQQQTAAMNRVADREDAKQIRSQATAEKHKDRAHAEKYSQWEKNFDRQLVIDDRMTARRIAEQDKAGAAFVARLDNDRQAFGDQIAANRDYLTSERQHEYWMNTPGGMDRYKELHRNLNAAEAFHETNYQAKYTAKTHAMMSEVAEKIQRGEDHPDLTQLYNAPLSHLQQDDDDWTDEEIRELRDNGGYVPGGLFGRDPDDPALKKYRGFNALDYTTTMQLIRDKQDFAFITHRKYQDDWLIAKMEGLADQGDAHGKMRKASKAHYDFLGETAEQATYAGVVGMIQDFHSGTIGPESLASGLTINSGGFAAPDMRNALAMTIVERVFKSVGGLKSEGLLGKLNEIVDGTGDAGLWDSDVELGLAFGTRSILEHSREQLLQIMSVPQGADGASKKDVQGNAMTSLSTGMVNSILSIEDSETQRNFLKIIAMQQGDVQRGKMVEGLERGALGGLTAVGEMRVHKGMDRIIGLALQKINHLIGIVDKQPSIMGYNQQVGQVNRLQDAYVSSFYSDKEPHEGPLSPEDKEDRRSFALENITDEQKRDAFGEAPEEFDIERDRLEMKIKLDPMSSYLELVGPYTDHPEFLAAMISGDFDNAAPEYLDLAGATNEEMKQHLVNSAERSKKTRDNTAAQLKWRRENHGRRGGQASFGQGTATQKGEPPAPPREG